MGVRVAEEHKAGSTDVVVMRLADRRERAEVRDVVGRIVETRQFSGHWGAAVRCHHHGLVVGKYRWYSSPIPIVVVGLTNRPQ